VNRITKAYKDGKGSIGDWSYKDPLVTGVLSGVGSALAQKAANMGCI